MSEANEKKYNIDELVDLLLSEREPEVETEELIDTADEEIAVDADENVSTEPSLLIDVEEAKEVATETVNEENLQKDEIAVSHTIDTIEKDQPSAQAETLPAPSAPKKRRGLFRRKMEDTATIERSWADFGIKPIGHSHRADTTVPAEETVAPVSQVTDDTICVEVPAHSGVGVDEFPEVKAPVETITMQVVLPSGVVLPHGEAHTRIIPSVDKEEKEMPVVADVPPADDEQLPDQISLEEMVRVEDIEPEEDVDILETDEVDPETRLQMNREEKVREFTLSGDEEEVNEPDEEPAEEEAEIEDFTGYQDTQTVADELKYRCRSSLLSTIFTGVIEMALLVITLVSWALDQQFISPMAYLITHLFGLVLMMGLNYSTITRGLSGLFTLRANNDTAPAVASTVCLVQVILHFLNMSVLPYWTPLAGLTLLFSAVAHYSQEVCVRRNFSFVSHPSDKYAAAVIEDDNALQEIGRRAVSDGDATVAYFRRTGFLSDYLANAYDEDCGDDWSRWLTPAALGLSVMLSLLTLSGEHINGWLGWLSVFTGMVCVAMPATLLAVQSPLSACCRRILARGGFINGWQAVRRFGQPDALAVDIADLYPDESMLLHGIKTFNDTHIDEDILTAASLVIRAGGPLSMIFRRIIENKEELLYEVDSLVYEQGMGLSGWVDGRRVFVGNGRLLQNHGVDVPSSDYEARYAKDGRRLVYLAVAGQLSAMFVVSYLPDPEIQSVLQYLCRSRVTLLVRSCDPNITASDLCDSFELDEYYVDVLPAAAGRMYVQLTEKTTDSLPAVMASNGHILGTARVLSACRGLQIKAVIALMVQTVTAMVSLLCCLLWAMNGTLSPIQPLLLLLVARFLTWFVPLFKRA